MGEARFPFPAYPNGWFRVAYAHELAAGDVQPLRALGHDFVLYRDEAGEAHLLDAHCRHLGAHLGYGGRVEGSGIRCPFHGWLWDGDGTCIDVPYSARIPRAARIRAWPLVERSGLLLVWHHAEQAPPDWQVPDLAEIGSDEWTPLEIRHWRVRSRWLDMNENAVDQVHFRYVHGTKTIPSTDVRVDGHLLLCSSRMKMGTPEGEVLGGIDTTDYGPAFQTVRLSGIIDTLMVNTSLPIDEHTTDVSFAYTVHRTSGGDAQQGVAAAIIRDLEKQMGEDIPIWENKRYHQQPVLCDGDGPFPEYRRWMSQFFSPESR